MAVKKQLLFFLNSADSPISQKRNSCAVVWWNIFQISLLEELQYSCKLCKHARTLTGKFKVMSLILQCLGEILQDCTILVFRFRLYIKSSSSKYVLDLREMSIYTCTLACRSLPPWALLLPLISQDNNKAWKGIWCTQNEFIVLVSLKEFERFWEILSLAFCLILFFNLKISL